MISIICALPLFTLFTLYLNAQSLNMSLLYNSNLDQNMILNNTVQPLFIPRSSLFDCSLSPLFSISQNPAQYQNNSIYTLNIKGLNDLTTFNLSTLHNNFNPTFVSTSSSSALCAPPSCSLTFSNNCQSPLDNSNYYDRIKISLIPQNISVSYYVLCNQQFYPNSFQWGLFILVIVVTIIAASTAVYSRAWSLGGKGFTVGWQLIIGFNVLLIIGGIVGKFSSEAVRIGLVILSWIFGILGVAVCINESLFLLKNKPLKTIIFSIKSWDVRIIQIISLVGGIGVMIGWELSQNNIFLVDIVCICMTIALIKLFKFVNLLHATCAFSITILIQLGVAIFIYVSQKSDYSSLFINQFNFPFQLQMPTINAVYNQKCAWLPINSLVYPGMLLSYLRRFDSTRGTNVYLITATILFFSGGIFWILLTGASPIPFPFGLISQPCMLGLVVIFAFRRKQLRVLWNGKFYDDEFANRTDDKQKQQQLQSRDSRKSFPREIVQQLIISPQRISVDSSMNQSKIY